MKRIDFKFLVLLFMLILVPKSVLAESYDINLSTNKTGKISPGDIIELTAGISCANSDPVVFQEFFLYYDMDVFDIVWPKEGTSHKLHNNWQTDGDGGGLGTINGQYYVLDDKYGATEENASDNCLDNKNFDIVTYKLQVKDVRNQQTSISLVNDIGYRREVKLNVYTDSNNTYLKNIKINNGDIPISPAFDKNVFVYEAYVDYNISKISIDSMLEDEKSKVKGNGTYDIVVGRNEFVLEVKAEDGSVKKYEIKVIRKAANDDTTLSKVEAIDSNNKAINLKYDAVRKEYIGEVSNEILFVNFDIVCSGEDCSVSKLNTEKLEVGKNEFTFKVTSQKGKEVAYKIIINKEEPKKDYTNIILIILLSISMVGNIALLVIFFIKKGKIKNEKNKQDTEL